MSTSSTRMVTAVIEGRSCGVPVRAFWSGSVSETFLRYRFKVQGLFDLRGGFNFWPEVFPRSGGCYAYLFQAHRHKGAACYKVGITRNLEHRYKQLTYNLPPFCHPAPLYAFSFCCDTWAKCCEESVLVACKDVWVRGEWLVEDIADAVEKTARAKPRKADSQRLLFKAAT